MIDQTKRIRPLFPVVIDQLDAGRAVTPIRGAMGNTITDHGLRYWTHQEESGWVGGYHSVDVDRHTVADLAKCEELGRRRQETLIVLNFETPHWLTLNSPTSPARLLNDRIDQLRYIVEAIRRGDPSKKIGFYNSISRSYWPCQWQRLGGTSIEIEILRQWQTHNDTRLVGLWECLDFVCVDGYQPYHERDYTATSGVRSLYDADERYATGVIAEGRRVAGGKPVVIFVSPFVAGESTPPDGAALPAGVSRTQANRQTFTRWQNYIDAIALAAPDAAVVWADTRDMYGALLTDRAVRTIGGASAAGK